LALASANDQPDRASFHSPAAFCATWAHKQIHSTGHESRLKRDLDVDPKN
jgi:antirestriction protein ArdC